MDRIGLVDTTFRDPQQCLWATRTTTSTMLPAAEQLDRTGFDPIEVVDADVRYLGRNTWQRIQGEHIRHTLETPNSRPESRISYLSPDALNLAIAEQLHEKC